MIRRLIALMAVCAGMMYPCFALAHATPVEYNPAPGVRLERVPEAITLRFSERLEPGASTIAISSRAGSVSGGVVQAGRSLTLAVSDIRGPVTVTWQVVSADDGHFTKGSYVFSIGEALSDQQRIITVEHRSSIWETVFIFLELLGQSMGMSVLIVWALAHRFFKDRRVSLRPFAILGVVAIGLMAVGCSGYAFVKAQEIGGIGSLSKFLATTTGRYTLYRLMVVVLAGFVGAFTFKNIFTSVRRRVAGGSFLAMLGFFMLMIVFRARVSHAAASTFAPGLSVAINALHLVAKEFLIGSYVIFVFGISMLWKHLAPGEKLRLLLKWWRASCLAVAIGGATGVYITWLHLKDISNLFVTQWGLGFVAVAIFGFLFFVAHIFNYRRILSLAKGQPMSEFNLSYSMPLAMILGLWILFLTSGLIITTPPLATTQGGRLVREVGGSKISLSQYRFDDERLIIELEDVPKGTSITVFGNNEAAGISKLPLPVECLFEYGCSLDSGLLVPGGPWQIEVIAQRPGGYDAVAVFSLPELFKTQGDTARLFALISVLAAAGLVVVSVFLYRHSRRVVVGQALESESLSLNTDRSWLFWLFVSAIFFNGVTGSHGSHQALIKSRFQKDCEQRGYTWQESQPMRAGHIGSQQSFVGCTLVRDGKQWHIVDSREYFYLKIH